jgi:hypothetical protein
MATRVATEPIQGKAAISIGDAICSRLGKVAVENKRIDFGVLAVKEVRPAVEILHSVAAAMVGLSVAFLYIDLLPPPL